MANSFTTPTVSGGWLNTASANSATVGGGEGNTASNYVSTVAGGHVNTASGEAATVAGGHGNTASGTYATVAGGTDNTATGASSFAAGSHATANQDECVVFGLWSANGTAQCFGTTNVFKVMGENGFSVDYHAWNGAGGGDRWLAIGPFNNYHGLVPSTIIAWNGAYLSDAGVWVAGSSSQYSKTDFDDVDVKAVLKHVVNLPITTWRYKQGEASIRHMGPMAEDFWDAFHIGYGDKTIADLDARGVEFAAIQGLHQLVQEKDAKIEIQQREIDDLRSELNAVKRAVAHLVKADDRVALQQTP